MRQNESFHDAGGASSYYGPRNPPPYPPRSEQYAYGPVTPPARKPRSGQVYQPAPRAPQVPQTQQQARMAAASAAKAQVRQRINTYKHRIVWGALAAFTVFALLAGFSIQQSSGVSASSGASNVSGSNDDSDSSSNFFEQGGNSNVGSSPQQPGSGTANS